MNKNIPESYWIRRKEYRRIFLLRLLIPTGLFAFFAALLYNFQDHITPLVESHDFCKNESIIDISTWIFPKLVSHCDAVTYYELRNHPSADIAILLDIYIALYCVCSLVFMLILLRNMTQQQWMDWQYYIHERVRNRKLAGLAMFFVIPCILIIGLFGYYEAFVSKELLAPEGSCSGRTYLLCRYSPLLSTNYGLGPIVQIFFIFFCNLMLFAAISITLSYIIQSKERSQKKS